MGMGSEEQQAAQGGEGVMVPEQLAEGRIGLSSEFWLSLGFVAVAVFFAFLAKFEMGKVAPRTSAIVVNAVLAALVSTISIGTFISSIRGLIRAGRAAEAGRIRVVDQLRTTNQDLNRACTELEAGKTPIAVLERLRLLMTISGRVGDGHGIKAVRVAELLRDLFLEDGFAWVRKGELRPGEYFALLRAEAFSPKEQYWLFRRMIEEKMTGQPLEGIFTAGWINAGNVDFVLDEDGTADGTYTLLHAAAESGNYYAVAYLLFVGADPLLKTNGLAYYEWEAMTSEVMGKAMRLLVELMK